MIIQKIRNRKGSLEICRVIIVLLCLIAAISILVIFISGSCSVYMTSNEVITQQEEKVIVEKPSLTPKVKEPTKQKEGMTKL